MNLKTASDKSLKKLYKRYQSEGRSDKEMSHLVSAMRTRGLLK